MRKREGMPQPLQHMVSAVGAGKQFIHSADMLHPFAWADGFQDGVLRKAAMTESVHHVVSICT